MTRDEKQTLKAKIKLYCVLHGISMGHRGGVGGKDFVYEEACRRCQKKNKGCTAYHRPVLLLNVHNMRMSLLDMNNLRGKYITDRNKMVWCVEWVHYV